MESLARRDGVAMRVRRDGVVQETTFAELAAAAREIAAGLIAHGIGRGDRVAILGNTRPEWTLADFGAIFAGATVVPVYHTNSPEECAYVLAHSEARVLICEDAEQRDKVESVRAQLPALEHVFTMVATAGSPSLDDLRAAGDPDDLPPIEVSPDDAATIVYTSGTTGPPKGCELTHGNLLATMRMYEYELRNELRPGVVVFMFLPLAHSLARVVQLVVVDAGATLAFWSGDPKLLLDDIAAARPHYLPSVPRVFEKIHAKALGAIDDGSPLRRRAFAWAIATGRRARAAERRGEYPGPFLRAGLRAADRLVLSRVRELFGGELRLGLTGAAPIGREVLEFFDACGVLILEGYGMTETCAAATLNTPGTYRFGTVGRPLPGSEVAIADDGEVLMRGPHVFAGYHRDDEATRDTFDDGWLCSGDLGEVDKDGFVAITGRKKDLIITSSGKNVSPTNLETALRETRWVSQAVVYGDNRPYLVALLTLDADELPALAERAGVEPDPATMIADPRVHAVIQESIDEVNARFARIEQIKRFALLEHDLSQAAGELTPTLKVKRATVNDRYREQFERLYDAVQLSPDDRSGPELELTRLATLAGQRECVGARGVGERLRIGDQAGVGEEPDGDLPGVAEDAHAHPDAARARCPHEHARHLGARDRQPRARARDVGEHHRALAGEVVDQAGFDDGRREPHQLEDPVRDGAFVTVLDGIHPPLDLERPLVRVLDVDRELEQDEAEPVAELARQRLVERAQVERHQRMDVTRLVTEAVGHRGGDGAHEDVVDRGVVRAGGVLDPPEVDRIAPGDVMGQPLLALDR